MTGLDFDAETEARATAPRIAPPPSAYLPNPNRQLTSQLHAVVLLKMNDSEEAIKRVLGRRLDPETGRVFHLEVEPPPEGEAGLADRLEVRAKVPCCFPLVSAVTCCCCCLSVWGAYLPATCYLLIG